MVWSCDTGEVLVVIQMIIAKYNQRQKPLYGISQAALWLDSTNHIKITQTVKLSFDGYRMNVINLMHVKLQMS